MGIAQKFMLIGLGIGAVAGVVAHLAGLDGWSAVPIGTGAGVGLGGLAGELWIRSRRRKSFGHEPRS